MTTRWSNYRSLYDAMNIVSSKNIENSTQSNQISKHYQLLLISGMIRKPADTEVSLPRQYKLNFNTFFLLKRYPTLLLVTTKP